MHDFCVFQRSSASPERNKYEWNNRSPGCASDGGGPKRRKVEDRVSALHVSLVFILLVRACSTLVIVDVM
jgi:hypothetical protein